MPVDLAILGGAWIFWCFLHSLFAWQSLAVRIKCRMGRAQGLYRVAYNLFALASLFPVWLLYASASGPMLVFWPACLYPLLWVARGFAIWMLLEGAKVYPVREFLGFPVREGNVKEGSRGLVVSGILGHVRHPWYLAGFLLLWSRDLAGRDLVTGILLSVYLWFGALLEERRLLVEFGEDYRRYLSATPRFLPRIYRRL